MVDREMLTEREKQVAAHVAGGLRVAGVAHELCLAENTVRNHLKRAFAKLDVHSQSELIELLRLQPSIVSPYQLAAGLSAGSDRDLTDEIVEVDRVAEKRIDESAASAAGLEGMKKILRAVLPLDETRRHEWRVRLAGHVVGPQQRAVRELSSEIRQKWIAKPLLRIEDFQARGWIREELDSQDVRRRLFSAVYAAVLGLMADDSPEEERRQLATIDRLLEEIASD
jgi:DNA-binding CsgD family transcriptional regulator